MKDILEEIEILRNKLNHIVKKKGVEDQEVLELSQHLDKFIAQYYFLLKINDMIIDDVACSYDNAN